MGYRYSVWDIRFVAAALMVAVQVGFAQSSEEPISESQAMLQETIQTTEQPAGGQDLSDVPAGSTETSYNDNQTPQQRFEENPKHNVHEYNYKQQAIVGGAVMFCVALAMIVNNNYNPKRGGN